MKITKKVIIIDSCVDCPHLIDLQNSLNFQYQKFFCGLSKRELFIKENGIKMKIPDWCELPDRLGDD